MALKENNIFTSLKGLKRPKPPLEKKDSKPDIVIYSDEAFCGIKIPFASFIDRKMVRNSRVEKVLK